jgi:putative FmdB family regulatory protein
MPTYEYECNACGHRFEKFQSMSSAPIRKCPNCGKTKVKRLLGTGAGIIFKGSGFYITDYRSENYKNAEKADTAPAASGSTESKSTEGAPAESKPAATNTEAKSEPPKPSESESSSKSAPKPASPKASGSSPKNRK